MGQVLGMGLMLLEQFQPGLQQRLQLGVVGVGNQGLAQGLVDRAMISDLVVDIGLVEGRARQSRQSLARRRRRTAEGGAWSDWLRA